MAFPFYEGSWESKYSERAMAILKDGYFDKFSKNTGKIHHITKSYVDDLATFDISNEISKIIAITKVIICSQDSEKNIKNGKALFEKLHTEKELIEIDTPHDPANTPETKAIFEKTIKDILQK